MLQIAPPSWALGKQVVRVCIAVLFSAIFTFLLVGCGSEPALTVTAPAATSPNTPTHRPTLTHTPTATAVPPTSTPTPTATPDPTPTPEGPLVSLPEDEAPHETPVEWWYFNGFLWDEAGNEFSFHFVTFQSPTLPVGTPHLLHATLADHQNLSHAAGERGALATLDPAAPSVDIDAEGWVMRGDGESYELRFDLEGRQLDLEAISRREPVLHDSTGLVDLGEAGETYYYSQTRMELNGWLQDPEGRREVSGSGWMDHQWGNISRVDVGWDWINLQLDDRSDLMVAVVWKPVEPGSVCIEKPCPPPLRERLAAYATFVDADGKVTHVPGEGVSLEATSAWVSPETHIEYPTLWRLLINSVDIELFIEPVLSHAEFDAGMILPVVYWEGAVTASGQRGGAALAGRGFVELVGYDPDQTTADIPAP